MNSIFQQFIGVLEKNAELIDRLDQGQVEDLAASEIEGLVWLENPPSFEAMAIDERGFPVRMVAVDPRVWAIHKLWVSQRQDRDPIKKRRDADQARAIAPIITRYFPHLPMEEDELRMLPLDVVKQAMQLFAS